MTDEELVAKANEILSAHENGRRYIPADIRTVLTELVRRMSRK